MSGGREHYGPSDDRTGNGMLNNGHGATGDGGALDGGALDGELSRDLGGDLGTDELALRRMLQGAVGDLQPRDGALDHLRRAVPARRARKRQALVGTAAAVLLLGTGIPAFVHVAGSDGTSDAKAVNAGHGQQVQGGTGDHTGGTSGEQAAGNPSGELGDSGGKDEKPQQGKPHDASSGVSEGNTGDGTAGPSTSAPATLPVCQAGQLGVISAQAGKPDAKGRVYGTFRVANVSGSDCAVEGAGGIGFQANGAADRDRITVAPHTASDPATGLPDPSVAAESLALKPSAAYEVKFAWVPKETCPVKGGDSPAPSTSPTEDTTTSGGSTSGSTEGSAGDGTTDTTTGTEPQLLTEDDTTPPESGITITHTPDPGAPVAEATVPGACVGTIYHTGLLPAK